MKGLCVGCGRPSDGWGPWCWCGIECRFWSKVEQDGDCWIWTAQLSPTGYGNFAVDGRPRRAHRWSYEFLVAEIPENLTLDHLCRRKSCVNPYHLEPVPASVNTLRMAAEQIAGGGNWQRRKTHCPLGHEYAGGNLYEYRMSSGLVNRQCKQCVYLRGWKRNQKLKERNRLARLERQGDVKSS